jgi:hypothetical protein
LRKLFFKTLENTRYYVLADDALIRNLGFFGAVTKVPKTVRTNRFFLRNLEIFLSVHDGLLMG